MLTSRRCTLMVRRAPSSGSRLVAQLVDQLHREALATGPAREERDAVAYARGGRRRGEPFPPEIRHDLSCRRPERFGQLLRHLEHVVVEVERGPHAAIIMHHASDVKAGARAAKARSTSAG